LNLKWKDGSFISPDQNLLFKEIPLSNNILELDTPLQFFTYFFNEELMQNIVNETELYSIQTNVSKPINLSLIEFRRYLGILIYSSVFRVPNVRDYWSVELNFSQISDAMSLRRYETIRRFLHFNNNHTMLSKDNPNFDRLHKIRPLIDHLNTKYSSVQCNQYLSVDEQLCATKARSYLKQYLPDKPHKWGYKLFVLCDDDGFSYKFEIFTGQENWEKFRLPSEPDLGASSNVVVRLTRNVPQNKNHKLYCDNYYTSIPLFEFLYQKGILALGTVRCNRIPNCTLPNDKYVKNLKRGTSVDKVSSYGIAPLSLVLWKDNKVVTLLSTYCGKDPTSVVKCYDKKMKTQIEVDCPFLIKEYNRHMGGVDLLDSHIGRYKIKIKSRKWYMRLFYHLLDITVVNSWIVYKRVCKAKDTAPKFTLAGWRKDLAYTLCKIGEVRPKKGRPSTPLQNKITSTRPQSFRPSKDVRIDQTSHWPIRMDKRGRCKYPNCKGFTNNQCSKCAIYLCNNKSHTCFELYHNK